MISSSSIAQAIVDTALDGMIVIDSRGIIRGFNPAAARMFDYSPEEVIGQSVALLVPEPQRPKDDHDDHIQRYLEANAANLAGRRRTIRGRRKDGSKIDLRLVVTTAKLQEERLFIGTLQRFTRADRAEEELGGRGAKNRNLLADLPVGLVYVAANGAVLSANAEAQHILKLS